MKKNYFTRISLGSLLCLLMLLTGSCINIGGCWPHAKYEKTIRLQTPLEPASTVVAKTSFGSITVNGAEVPDCNVVAKIRVQAPTEQEAAEIAEQVKIDLVPDGKTLTVKADKPRLKNNRSISISYKITTPRQTSLDCSSSFGTIKLRDINGSVNVHTSYGSIKCADINGRIRLDTSYGQVRCNNIISDELTVDSSYGHIDIEYSNLAPAEIQADASTSYGGIDFEVPPGFAGDVQLTTNFGSIRTDLPITVKGEISKKQIRGTIGEGKGKVRLKTSFGSIKIK